jgi:hypothetical protein
MAKAHRLTSAIVLISVVATACSSTTPPPPAESATPAIGTPPGMSTPRAAATETRAPTQATGPIAPAGPPMEQVLELVPAEARSVSVTDWAAIRAIEGIETVNDDPDDERRIRFIADIYPRHATPSYFAGAKLGRHAETWGWDSLDLLWEATIDVNTASVHVLQLPPHFDTDRLGALFEERGFVAEEHAGVPVYRKRIVPSDEWVTASDLAIANSALLVERRVLVMSRDPDGVHAVLDALEGDKDSLADADWAGTATEALSDQAAVTIVYGPELCEMFWAPWEDREALLQEMDPINEFQWLALGYHYPDDRPVVSVVLGYDDEEAPAQDIGSRTYWASEATEMDVLRVERRGTQLVFEFRPPSDQPRILFELSWTDFFFAVC